MTRNERKLKAIEETMASKAREIQDFWAREEKEDRELSEDERSEVLERTKALEELKKEKSEAEANIALEQEVKQASKGIVQPEPAKTDAKVVNEPAPTLGKQFIESEGYMKAASAGFRGGFSTGEIALEAKGTLTTTPGTALTPAEYQPGVVETLFQRNYVSDRVAQATTTSSVVRYVEETVATNSASGVAEGADKPESTLTFDEVSESVKKIATYLPVSDEMLEDAAQIESYINSRLSLFIRNEEELQVLRGTGSNDLQGIIGKTGVNTVSISDAGSVVLDNLFTVMNNTRSSSFVDPDLLVLNPTDWATIRLAKDANNQYHGGGPFYGPYGGPQGPTATSQFSSESIWGVPVVVTQNIGSGTALLGAFASQAQLFRRTGLSVEASNSHSDYFVKNLTAIRAEERLALAVYRPQAFTTISFT